MMDLRLLIIEDSDDDVRLLVNFLREIGYSIEYEVVSSADSLQSALNRREWDLITSDYSMPGFDGMRALTIVREQTQDTPFILVSGKIGEERAITALRQGATDYIPKDNPGRLHAAIERALRERRDRRQRAEAEKALQAAQDRLGSVLSLSPAVIFNLRVIGRTIVPSWVSENVTRMTGFTPTEVLMPGWHSARVYPEDKAWVRAEMDQLFELGELIQEYRLLTRSNEVIWVRDEMRYLEVAPGQPAEIVASWTDITDRKTIEAQLRQAQKMEAVGRLAGGIAHDFNNILTVIQMQSYFLLSEEGLPGNAREAAEQVSLAAERAANLTRQLLTFSRKQVAQLKPTNLNEVVENMTRMLSRLLGEDIRIKANLQPNPPPINADTGMLEQVLMNLAVNSRDAMPRGGQLRISSCQVTHDEHYLELHPQARPGQFICLTIEDTGCGIAPEQMAHVFEPFYTTKPVGRGTGLGLATVYGIVELHRGWISVYSDVGCGTCFRIYLPPAAPGSVTPETESAAQALRGGNEGILLVEDEHELRSLVRCALESCGYRVHEARSGPDALRVWAECRDQVDLLLTDMVMPEGVTGIELAERLRSEKPSLKVICSSGYSAELVQSGMGLPAKVRFLQKPFHSRQLSMTVREVLDEGRLDLPTNAP